MITPARLLERVTMYRLVAYGLIGLALVSLIFALLGRFSFTPLQMLVSCGLLLGSAFGANVLFSRLWRVPTNRESWLITALILFFVLEPAGSLAGGLALVLAGALSSAAKFILAPFGKHIFNPAALAAAVLSLSGLLPSTWWVGSSALWPFTLVLGALVVFKIRRVSLYASFIAMAVVLQIAQLAIEGHPLLSGLTSALIASPLLFLAGIMLTEPSTMPPTRPHRIVFAAIVAFFYVGAWEIGPFIIYPEVALLIGNLYAFGVGPRERYRLTLHRIERTGSRVATYFFSSNRPVRFHAGQYAEFTLAAVPEDGRGNRRTFTVASAPSEREIAVGLKYYDPSSTYKARWNALQPGDTVFAGGIAGDFTLPRDQTKKIAFVAGGIGITPFRSMIQSLIDAQERRDIVIVYASVPDELAYRDVFESAATLGVSFLPVTDRRLDGELLARLVPDLATRTSFIAGPQPMVVAVRRSLRALGVPRARIRTDYFSGY